MPFIDVKYKLYLCLMQCKKPKEALNMLQSIPAKVRIDMEVCTINKKGALK